MHEKDGRIAYIDIARALAVYLVVLGHTSTRQTIVDLIYSFHMPCFFLISGMLLKRKNMEYSIIDVRKTIKKRTISYYIPYLIWGLFYTQLNLTNFLKIVYGTREMLVKANAMTSLWFLPAILVASSLAEIVMWMGKKHTYIIAVADIILFVIGFTLPHIKPYGYPLGFDAGIVGAGFMLAGYFMRGIIDRVSDYGNRNWILIGIGVGGIVFLVFNKECLMHDLTIYISMYSGSYGNLLIFLFNAFLGTFIVLGVAIAYSRFVPKDKLFSYLGQNTLGILVLHKPMVIWGRKAVWAIGYSSGNIFVAILLSVLGTIASILITGVIAKILPELVGKKRANSY